MTFEYKNTSDDYIRFNLFHLDNGEDSRVYMRIVQFGMAIVFLIMYLITAMLVPAVPEVYWMIVYVIITLAWIVFYPALRRKRAVARLQKVVRSGALKDFEGEHSLTLEEDHMVTASGGESARLPYKAVASVGLDGDAVYIIGNKAAFVLPGNAFPDSESRKELVSLLRERTNATWVVGSADAGLDG